MICVFLIFCLFVGCNADCSFHCEALSCPCQCYRHDLRCFNKSLTHIWKFPSHENFKYLDFANNKIRRLKTGQFQTTYFKTATGLQLSTNYIENIEDGTFKGLTNLHSLFLSSNKIKNLNAGTFVGLESIKRIYLDNNQLKILHRHIFNHVRRTLKLLYLQSNRIEYIDASTFVNLPQLKTLDLSNNQLKTLDGSFVQQSPKLSHLFLSQNHWNCDVTTLCQTLGVIEQRNDKEGILLDTIVCLSPTNHTGKDAMKVFKTFDCTEISSIRVRVSGGSTATTTWVNTILVVLCLFAFVVFQFVLFVKPQ